MPRIHMERSGEMEIFVRVVREGGFSAAARTLDLTPSAVSKLIARLEARLGTQLMVRTTRALSLTEEGEAYHRAALAVVQELNEAELVAGAGAVRGKLVISASVPFGSRYIAPIVPEFLVAHPDIVIDLSLTDDVVDLVAQRADIAIRVGTLPDSALMARKLGETRRVVCAAPAYLERCGIPALPADLIRHNCLTFNFRRLRGVWPFLIDGHHHDQGVTGNLLINNGETMRQMVLAGAGIARLGLFHVAEDIVAGRLVALLEPWNRGDLEYVHAVYVGGGKVPRRVRAFIDYLTARMAGSPYLDGAALTDGRAPRTYLV